MNKTEIQSVLLNKNYYTLKQAKAKIKLMGFEPIKFHETEEHYRFRIQNPRMFEHFRTKHVQDGITFIIGIKK